MDWNIPVVQQNTLMGELAKMGELKGQQQQQRLIDMKLQQAPEELAMQREIHQANMANNQAQADEHGIKAQGQKAMLAKNVATTILKQVSSSGAQPGTPEFQDALNAAGNPYRGMMAKIFDHPDEGKPMDYNALQSLANYQGPEGDQKVIYSQQHAADGEYKFNGVTGEVEPIMHGGKQLRAAQYSPQLQGDIAAQKENAKIDQVTLSDGRKVPMRMGSAVSDGRGSAPPQFDISPDASREDRAILEKMQAQTGGITAPVTIGQSTADEAAAKAAANIEQKKQEGTNAQQLEQNDPKRIKALGDADYEIGRLEQLYKKLDALNGVTNSNKGTLSNLSAGISSSYPGRAIGGAIGSKEQSIRDEINNAISTMVPIIKKASDTTGGQINSVEELKQFLRQMGSTDHDVNATFSQLKDLRRMYGGKSDAGDAGGGDAKKNQNASENKAGKVKFLGFE